MKISFVVFLVLALVFNSGQLCATTENQTEKLFKTSIDPGKKAFYALQLISGNKEKFVFRFPKYEKDIVRAKNTNLYGKASFLTFQIQHTINVRNSTPQISNILAAKNIFAKLKEQKAVELLTIFEADYYFKNSNYTKSSHLYESIHASLKQKYWEDKNDLVNFNNYCLYLSQVAFNYFQLNDTKKSIASMMELIHSIDPKKNVEEYTLALNNIGSIYSKDNKEYKAIYFYRKALKLVKENNFSQQYNLNEINIVRSYFKIYNYEKAKEYLNTISFKNTTDSTSVLNIELSTVLLLEIKIAVEQQNFSAAKLKIKELNKYYPSSLDIKDKTTLYIYSSRIYESEKDFQRALSNYKNWAEEYERVRKKESEQTKLIQRKYLNAEKNRIKVITENSSNKKNDVLKNRIQLFSIFIGIGIIILLIYLISRLVKLNKKLFQKTKLNSQMNKKLIISLKDKEILLQEVHHRVKNNFQIISSLLNIQANRLTSEEQMRPLLEAKDRILSMSLVHQKLYTEKRNELEKVLFGEYLIELVMNLRSIHCENEDELILTTSIDEIFVDLNKAVPLALFSNEVITNAFKYGRSKNGKLHLNIQLKDLGAYNTEFTISDQGTGFQKSEVEQTDSIGTQLKSLLADQIEGTLSEENENGAHIQLRFYNEPDELKTI